MGLLENLNWCLKGPYPYGNKETDTEYKVETYGTTLKIGFEGTKSRRDWIENFRFWVKMYKDMDEPFYCHKGFWTKYHSVRDEILDLVTPNITRVRVMGFSQGAAMATLAFEDIEWHHPWIDIKGYAFGSPRVLWLPKYSVQYRWWFYFYNIVNGNDIVCKLPPAIMGYKQVGRIMRFGERLKWWKLDRQIHTGAEYRRVL